MRPGNGPVLTWLLAVSLAAAVPGAAVGDAPAAADVAFFEQRVRPVLAEHCYKCHSEQTRRPKGLLLFDSRDGLRKGGESGPAIVPGKPKQSLLLRALRYEADAPHMPPDKQLPANVVADLEKWIASGAPDPRDKSQAAEIKNPEPTARHWAFQPVRRPPLPVVLHASWPLTPVDNFVLAELEKNGLTPSAPADRRTLIRRATFDLTGLPPTPEDVAAFVADARPDAYPRLVERLLASPHYGERWGRHWLDVVRYADTAGETADFPVPDAWRYRNYVIAAFNQDKPYDQFLREQIAGDILAAKLPPGAPAERYAELMTATGYVAVARRFGYDITKDQHLTIEDTIDTLGKSVLGLTVACARCHDHKYDPVSKEDYYGLYGIFDSTRYPFPGCEHTKTPRDMVPLVRAAAGDRAKPPLAYAVAEGKPHNSRVHKRGDPATPGAEAARRNLSLFGGQPVPKGGGSGRLALAEWWTGPGNPLTARVMVNRIWQHHFGTGLVKTPNDFGTRGVPPSHPELLDWLADEFVRQGWSVKAMHRLILLSATYRQAGHQSADDKWLGHFPRRRLSAEEIRDAMLAVSGDLDMSPCGPHPFPDAKKWGYTQHNPFTAVYDTNRRSVYLMTQRIKRHPFLALFDGADPNSSTPERHTTIVPTQALFFMNDPFVHARSARLADRLLKLPDDQRLERLTRLVYGRSPLADERSAAARLLADYQAELTDVPPAQRPGRAWAALARVLLSSNEFLFVD
jgi:hypothetical protein